MYFLFGVIKHVVVLALVYWCGQLVLAFWRTKEETIDGVASIQIITDDIPAGVLFANVHVCMTTKTKIVGGIDALKSVVEKHLCCHPQFLQVPVFSWWGPPRWKRAKTFNVANHVLEREVARMP